MKHIQQNQCSKSCRSRLLNELVSLPDEALIGVNEAALLIGRSRETIRRWRKLGIGPSHLKHPLGSDYAQYQIGIIRNWIKGRINEKLTNSVTPKSKLQKHQSAETQS